MEVNGNMYTKRILLTGGAGFIGSHVLTHFVLTYHDYYIVNLDCMDYCASVLNFKEIEHSQNFKFIEGNICNADLLRRIFRDEKIDSVLHLAAKSHVDLSFKNGIDFTKTNVLGTNVLLMVAHEFGVNKFLYMSTDEVYGETGNVKADENFPLNPTNPYSGSKAAAECIAKCYINAFKIPIVIVRCNNVYGPKQFPEKVVPKFISLLQRKQKCFLHGNGSSKRSFLHVSDAVRALDLVFHEGLIGEVYNVGTSFEMSIMDLAIDLIGRIIMCNNAEISSWYVNVEDRPFNDDRYHLELRKIHKLGWKPQISWDKGISETIKWYEMHLGENSRYWDTSENVLAPFPKFMYDDVKTD